MEPAEGRKKKKRKIYRGDNGISEQKGNFKKKRKKEKDKNERTGITSYTVIVIAYISYINNMLVLFPGFFAIMSGMISV